MWTLWVVLSAQTAIALGTLLGGWRIVKTMGQRICKLRPIDGVCAETASAVSIFSATYVGAPVSTTHVITGAISGVGAAKRIAAVRWNVTLRIVWAWGLTIPGAGATGARSPSCWSRAGCCRKGLWLVTGRGCVARRLYASH